MKKSIIPILILLSLGCLSMIAYGQERVAMDKEKIAQGITIQVMGNDLASDSKYIALVDSLGMVLAPKKIVLNNREVWLKQTRDPVTRDGVVHWYYYKENGVLIVDIQGLLKNIQPQTQLQIVVVPLNSQGQRSRIEVYELDQVSNLKMNPSNKLTELKINIQ